MSADVTMRELELQTAELLPARETLRVHHRPGNSFSQSNLGLGSANQVAAGGSGNGALISVLNGNDA